MHHDELSEKTKALADTIRKQIGSNEIGFLLVTVAISGDAHSIFSATNQPEQTALYMASMVGDMLISDPNDTIGAVAGSA